MMAWQGQKNWTESLRSGDHSALSFCFKLHARSLGFFANRLINDPLEAEDVVAECFAKLWERRRDFKTEENIKAFLYISCRNACLDVIRRAKVKTRAQKAYSDAQEGGEDTILNHMITAEVLAILDEEIEMLPDNYKDVFKLIYFDLKKTEEIADRLGLSEQTVRNYKTRAVNLLKTAMLKRGISSMGIVALLLFIESR
ncbi:RNA polymerase sigma factor [Pedobacter deserti]|uniref:RNA polymerase sigma factor n=1 Tax=Pedobacter deserti TaxID=2817382 RepID=UPI00210A45BA|nr:sigma-70 family RNA polymerase sigma factor [Pedobacter sp. SYSU D00382]